MKLDLSGLELLEDMDYVELMIPQESINLYSLDNKNNLKAKIIKRKYAGEKTYYHIDINGLVLKSSVKDSSFNEGDIINIDMSTGSIAFFVKCVYV